MLRFERKPASSLIWTSGLAGQRAVEEIAGVELDARLGRRDLEHPSARWILHARRQHGLAPLPIQHEIVVIAVARPDLRIAGGDARANRGRLPEVEGRAVHAGDTGGYQP